MYLHILDKHRDEIAVLNTKKQMRKSEASSLVAGLKGFFEHPVGILSTEKDLKDDCKLPFQHLGLEMRGKELFIYIDGLTYSRYANP